MNAMDVALICKALGDANRLEIVKMLSDGEKCGCKLLERFEITQPTLSHQFITAKTPAGRWGEPDDMVGPCVFLASHASDFVNGQILYADGGILAYIGRQPK